MNPNKSTNRNLKALDSFVAYCYQHPEQRFWQALRNWSRFDFIVGVDATGADYHSLGCWAAAGIPYERVTDTFDLEDFEGTKMVLTDERDGMQLYQY